MTAQQLIDLVDALYPNAETTANKISFMNIAIRSLSHYFGLVVEDDSLVTVADQDSYSFPTGLEDVEQIIALAVGNSDTPSSRYDYTKHSLSMRDDDPMRYNSFWQIIDSTGAKKLALYPAPTLDDLPIIIRFHKKLAELSSSSLSTAPEFDSRYHDMLAFYCIHMICSSGASPDTIQANAYMQKYDERLTEMWRLQMEKDQAQNLKGRANDQWYKSKSFGRGF